MNELFNELVNAKAVYRTSPATPGLLIILNWKYALFYFKRFQLAIKCGRPYAEHI